MDSRNRKSSNKTYKSVRFENSKFANLVKKYSHCVDIAYKECKKEDSFLPYVPDLKDDEASKKHRHQGKIFLREEKYLEAIKAFTEALKTAKSPMSVAKSLIRRSAVLYRVGLYRECLEDIKTAKEYGIPLDKRVDVNLRQAEAEKLQHNQESYRLGFSRFDEGDSDAVRLKNNYICANRDIKAGDLIAVEDPIIATCKENALLHCHHCMKITFSGVPCSGCTQAHYCSLDCLNDAYEQYHKEECKIVSMLQPHNVYGIIARMALAIRYNVTETEGVSDELIPNWYLEILKKKVSYMRIVPQQTRKTAARIYHAIENYTDFIIRDHAEVEQACVLKGLIIKLLLLRKEFFKTQTVTKKLPSGKLIYESEIEMCHTFDFFYKHSWFPNVITVRSGVRQISIALSNIGVDEQLCVSRCYRDIPLEEERIRYISCIIIQKDQPLFGRFICKTPGAKILAHIEIVPPLMETEEQKNKQRVLIDELFETVGSAVERKTNEYATYANCLHKSLTSLYYMDDPMDYLIKYISQEKNYL